MNGEIEMKDGQYFRPTVNEVYTNKNGSQYRCLSADGFDAEMIHTTSKWRFKALGCHMYDDNRRLFRYRTEKNGKRWLKIQIKSNDGRI